jgi:hypothetical protein
MALDERRPSFLNSRLPGACEVWFRGVHSDVGGGNGNLALNDIALRWMMRKAMAAGLPIRAEDVPNPDAATLEPSHDHRLPFPVRLVSAVDRRHYTVSPLPGWTNPPETCPAETEADERAAARIGANGIETQSEETRQRVAAMWEAAVAVTAANDFSIDPIRDALLTLFEARSPLVTDEDKLNAARDAVRRLMLATVNGARQRGFHVLAEFFLNEALFGMPRVFPLTD